LEFVKPANVAKMNAIVESARPKLAGHFLSLFEECGKLEVPVFVRNWKCHPKPLLILLGRDRTYENVIAKEMSPAR
jgi:hypothetical protein